MPTKKKKRYNSRFPPARIKKIMQSDEEVGKVAAAVPVIISRALELFVETLLGNVNRAISDRGARTMTPSHLKMCIHSEPRFDFLKELVADVPELQGDTDEKEPQVFSDSLSTTASTSAAADTSSKNGSRPRMQRQSSTSRPRGRPRKASTDARTKPKSSSNRRFVDIESDESDSQVADMSDDDDDEASPLGGSGSARGGTTSSLTQSLPSSPLVLSRGVSNPLSFTLESREPTFQRSLSYHISSNGGGGTSVHCQQQLAQNGGQVTTTNSLFTMTIPAMAIMPSSEVPPSASTISGGGGRKVSQPAEVSVSEAASSTSNGLFSVSRLVDAAQAGGHKSTDAAAAAASTYQPMASSYSVVDEDYDA